MTAWVVHMHAETLVTVPDAATADEARAAVAAWVQGSSIGDMVVSEPLVSLGFVHREMHPNRIDGGAA